jgi:hypothetical protein
MIIVQPFEEAEDTTKKCDLTGKNAEDIFVDRVNELASDAVAFHGNINSSNYAFGNVPELPKIPVQTVYGITIHGISMDDVRHLYERVRYDQWNITGDIYEESGSCHVRVRLANSEGSSEWEVSAPEQQALPGIVRSSAQRLIAAANPELAGRALLQELIMQTNTGRPASQEQYVAAEDVFREWIASRPQDRQAYYYLMATLYYQGADLSQRKDDMTTAEERWKQASLIVDWLNDGSLQNRIESAESDGRKGWDWRDRLLVHWYIRHPESVSSADRTWLLSKNIQSLAGANDEKIKQAFTILQAKDPFDPNTLLDSGIASAALALDLLGKACGPDVQVVACEKRLNPDDKRKVLSSFEDALQLERQAEILEPSNPGVHRDVGKAWEDRANALGDAFSPEALDEFDFALHLDPAFRLALEDDYKLRLENPDGGPERARTLCNTITILESSSAGAPDHVCTDPLPARTTAPRASSQNPK